jgi:hypothetical protein
MRTATNKASDERPRGNFWQSENVGLQLFYQTKLY